MISKKHFSSFGFTLIELLVVIAILGVLAGGILVAINPLEQLARARDAGRKTTVDSLGKAVQAYYTSQSGVYPTADTSWMDTLKGTGELKIAPQNPDGGTGYSKTCTSGMEQKGYCYFTNGTDAIVYARAESHSSFTSAADGGCDFASKQAWIVWSSAEGKTGLVCMADKSTEPGIDVTDLK